MPKISVVIPSLNQSGFIGQAINSVIAQEYPNTEIIVVDGGSTDGSAEIIQSYASQLKYWVVESDRGQSDALNKGFDQASGELLTWLNSDDILLPGALQKIAREYKKHPEIGWYTGNTVLIDEGDLIFRCCRSSNCISLLWKLACTNIDSPTAFFSRNLFVKAGGFDVNLQLRMDNDLWCRFFQIGARFRRVPDYLWCFRWHKDAKTTKELFEEGQMDMNKLGTYEKERESKLVENRYFPSINKRIAMLAKRANSGYKLLSGKFFLQSRETYLLKGKKWQEVFPSSGEGRIEHALAANDHLHRSQG